MSDNFLGFDIKNMAAGLAGGLSIALATKKPKPWELVSSMLVGGLTAIYVAPTFASVTGIPLLMGAFFVGAGGKQICLKALQFCQEWLPNKE